jgi:hypothetical protein
MVAGLRDLGGLHDSINVHKFGHIIPLFNPVIVESMLGDIITGDHPRHSMVAINHLHYSKKNQLNYSLYLSNIQI